MQFRPFTAYTDREEGMEQYDWECPICGWRVTDGEYLAVLLDPDCVGCGAVKWSAFKFTNGGEEDEEG